MLSVRDEEINSTVGDLRGGAGGLSSPLLISLPLTERVLGQGGCLVEYVSVVRVTH